MVAKLLNPTDIHLPEGWGNSEAKPHVELHLSSGHAIRTVATGPPQPALSASRAPQSATEPQIKSLKRQLLCCHRVQNAHLRGAFHTSPFGPASAVLFTSFRVTRLRLASARLINLIRGSLRESFKTLKPYPDPPDTTDGADHRPGGRASPCWPWGGPALERRAG